MLSMWLPFAVISAATLSAGLLWLVIHLSNRKAASGPAQCVTVLRQAPAIVFSIDASGALQWSNEQFERLNVQDRQVFLNAVQERRDDAPLRLCCHHDDGTQDRHYELVILGNYAAPFVFAEDVTRLVQADSVRNAFVQTLTKTFADLSTGLLVFDRNQRLVLFNPAILDLTCLSAEFLTSRPHMIEFFDALRDQQVMPEPRNYSSWRSQITDMIKSAENGHYSERWSLPHGVTYQLTGRPHPNGAIAFLIEDISDEMALTRRSRSQLVTHQAILDSMTDAIAVIGSDGNLVICNTAFTDCLGFDPEASLGSTRLNDIVTVFRSTFGDDRTWRKLEELSLYDGQITPLRQNMTDKTGRNLTIRLEPLPDSLFMLTLS